jgi:hypothetical protein
MPNLKKNMINNVNDISEACDEVPRQIEGDYISLAHPYSLPDKWLSWETSINARIKQASSIPDVRMFF